MDSTPTPSTNVAPEQTGLGYRSSGGSVICASCGCEGEWEECHAGCEDGYFDGYEEDPLWYDEGELVPCNECRGYGGSWWCINRDCKTGEIWKIAAKVVEPAQATEPTDSHPAQAESFSTLADGRDTELPLRQLIFAVENAFGDCKTLPQLKHALDSARGLSTTEKEKGSAFSRDAEAKS